METKMMHQVDIDKLASIFRQRQSVIETWPATSRLPAFNTFFRLCTGIADWLEKDIENFDRVAFLRSCGLRKNFEGQL